MNRITTKLLLLALAPFGAFLTSCETDDLEGRVDRRTDAYESFQDRRKIRTDSRQDRTDAWFDRVMGD